MKQINISVDEEMYEGLVTLSEENHNTLPEMLRALVRSTLLPKREVVKLIPVEDRDKFTYDGYVFEGQLHRCGKIWWLTLKSQDVSFTGPAFTEFSRHTKFELKLDDGRTGMVHLREANACWRADGLDICVTVVGVDNLQ